MTNETMVQVMDKPVLKSTFDYFVFHVLSNSAFDICMAILVVGLIALVLQFRLFKAKEFHPDDYLKTSAIILIITFSMALGAFLTEEDLRSASPIFGIFGTISGYLLGSAKRQRDKAGSN